MKIYYKNDKNDLSKLNIEELCNIEQIYYTKANSKAIIYIIKINNIPYISKNYNKDNKSQIEFETEKEKYFLVLNSSNNNILFKLFFIQYILIAECNNMYIIIMNKLKYNLNLKFLNTIDTEEKNNLLIQTLIILYDMNHNNMIYMNDIYTERGLRNIMVTNVKHNIKNIEYIFDTYNTKLIIPINKYKIKIIDYGWINKYPEFRTTEYMEKYFNNLYKNKIISEVILFTYFYFINCNLNKTYILPLINKFISDIYTTDVKKLDYLFITNLIKYMQSHPNFYIYNIQ